MEDAVEWAIEEQDHQGGENKPGSREVRRPHIVSFDFRDYLRGLGIIRNCSVGILLSGYDSSRI